MVVNSLYSAAATATKGVVKRSAVLYHYPCPDGAFAALAAHIYFSHFQADAITPPLFFPNTVYSPLRVEDLPLNEIGTIYLLDFVGPPGFLQQLSPKVERVVVLDHHKTALEMLGSGISTGSNVVQIIDPERSAATIAYDYFMQQLLLGADLNSGKDGPVIEFRRVRRLLEYIEDGDLWRWHLPYSREFSSGLKDLNLDFDVTQNPFLFKQLLSLDIESVISQGMSSLARKQRTIAEILEKSYEIGLGGGAFGCCLAVDADSVSHLRSEIGAQLAIKSLKTNLRAIGAVVYRVAELQNDQLLKVSLRSVGEEDTTTISEEYGGGGHSNASSFMINYEEFQKWKVSANYST